MVTLTKIDTRTKYCEFAIDSDDEINDLPKINLYGKGTVSTITCCQGSIAVGTHGKIFILQGEKNEWIEFK